MSFLANTRFTATWQGNTEAQKSEYLVAATFWLDQVDYAGTRCSPSTDNDALPQALAWPRSGATCDGIEATCSFIPSGIKSATAVLAVTYQPVPTQLVARLVAVAVVVLLAPMWLLKNWVTSKFLMPLIHQVKLVPTVASLATRRL